MLATLQCKALGASMPEFASFQDEPPQMRSGTVGKTGFLRLGFEQRSGETVLANLQRQAPYVHHVGDAWNAFDQ